MASPAVARCDLGQAVELPVAMVGQTPLVPARIGQREFPLVVDSGAQLSMLNPSVASALGLTTRPAPDNFRVHGVGGQFDIGIVTVPRFELGGKVFGNVNFLVGGTEAKGAGLLGQNMLGAADIEYDRGGGGIRMFDPVGCSADELAYWAARNWSTLAIEPIGAGNRHIIATVELNGQPLRAAFDTGAVYSILSLEAARRAGFKPGDAGVVAGGTGIGLGQKPVPAWILPATTLRIGDESIRSSGLRIADIGSIGVDMLIGADFFRSHRVYVANSQRKLLFTYAGGPIFGALPDAVTVRDPVTGAPTEWRRGSPVAALADAEAYARRGMVALQIGDGAGALADFNQAVMMKPAEPRYLFQRAQSRLLREEGLLARADLDAVLTMRPDMAEARLVRARLFVISRDVAGARQDLEAVGRILPAGSDLRLATAATYVAMEDWSGALGQFDIWLAANPGSARRAEALNGRCWGRAMLNQALAWALDDCNAAIALQPQALALRDSRAMARLRTGDLAGAIADYDLVLKTLPDLAWSLLGRGLARRRSGRDAEGRADIAAAVAREPGIVQKAVEIGLIASAADPR